MIPLQIFTTFIRAIVVFISAKDICDGPAFSSVLFNAVAAKSPDVKTSASGRPRRSA